MGDLLAFEVRDPANPSIWTRFVNNKLWSSSSPLASLLMRVQSLTARATLDSPSHHNLLASESAAHNQPLPSSIP